MLFATCTGVNIDVTDLIEKENFISQAKLQIEQLQLSALRSAMNPHFIFNALNSIQFFITQNQRENAIGYLSKFSRLIRGILDSTTAKKSTVASELELIKYYVEIEQLRFEHRFDFHLKVQHGLDTEMIELPALMLQPFVENAILHGLHTKKDRGLLEIEVTEAAEAYCITISDNGIGREAAMEIQRANFPDHKSKGLQLNAERVEIINHRRSIKVAVNDLKSNGKASGTRVQIIVAKG
jgi:sensor histidine kinase YesM